MNKYICILLLTVILTNAQDLPWAGNYTVINTLNFNGTDTSQCCVPSALNIMQDETNNMLLTMDFDFGAGSSQCNATLVGMITLQQEVTWGRVILNDTTAATLDGAHVIYLPNNNTILLKFASGCRVYYGNGSELNLTETNYTERYEGIWVREAFWPSDPNATECCTSIQPMFNAYDEFTRTEAYVYAFPDTPICGEDRGVFGADNDTIDGGAALGDDWAEFMLPNGSIIAYNAPPHCNSVYLVKRPTTDTNLCSYVDEINGGNSTNDTATDTTTDTAAGTTTDTAAGTTTDTATDTTTDTTAGGA